MAPNENPNQRITDAKDHLSHLKTEIEANYAGNAYTEEKVDEIKRAMDRTKLQDAERAADQADTETLNALALEIAEAEDELSTFAETENVPGAQEFTDETLRLKNVIAQKIREKQTPKTFTDRLGEMAEKISQGVANIMEKINDWASKLSLGALNGLKMLASMLGFESAVLFLNRFTRPAEVRSIIAENIPAGAEVVRDATDTESLKKLEKAYEQELKRRFPEKKEEDKTEEEKKDTRTPQDKLSFIDFCKKRADNLPQDKKKYSIKDLLTGNEQPDTPDEEEDTDKPEQPANPNNRLPNGKEKSPEKQNQRKAVYITMIAESLMDAGVPLVTAPERGRPSRTLDRAKDMGAANLNTARGVTNVLWTLNRSVQYALSSQKALPFLPFELDGNKLQYEDGTSGWRDPNILLDFNLSANPELIYKQLANMKIENHVLLGASERINLNETSERQLRTFFEKLKEAEKRYKKILSDTE